ncbi:MAG TPA: glycosyltransferase family 39 protein [Solirubrobacteraceae bacterium]|nr:glycosyltransferase family 39 protein [Solirubrobacteraceae bacterium]
MSLSFETDSARSPAARRPLQGSVRADRPDALSLTGAKALAARLPRPELLTLLVLAGVLDLWALSRNGWANSYYSAAARSMSSSWHNFLFASMDPSGVMSIDKPPLAVWVQALSVRAFGYHPLSVLMPQALMGVASVALVYDLVRRRFGRLGGFVAGLALATTPIVVAISRHNNPDALLVLCCVAALWCAVRGLEAGRTRWLVLAGVFVGLGFETKMGVALTVVPGIFVAWLWIDPRGRGRLRAFGQLLGGGAAMVAVGGAWPMLVELTSAADRPWVSGTSDNSVLSLILDYNGLNRVGGQAGVPTGVGGNMSGGPPGPLRLLSSALGGQTGWLLGFVLVALLGMVAASRLRRSDARSGWLIAVGGAFLVTAALFSFAGGIFHPYYVALLAPFIAALAGAGFAELVRGGLGARIVGPLAVVAGVVVELVIRGRYPGQLAWLAPLLITVGVLAAAALAAFAAWRVRVLATGAAMGALLLAPSVWAVDTLGYATSGTFPSGGPESTQIGTGGGPMGRIRGAFGPRGALPSLLGGPAARPQLFGAGPGGPPQGGAVGQPPPGAPLLVARGGAPTFGGGHGRLGGQFGDDRSIAAVLSYVTGHGGGTIAVSSQSSAAAAIIDRNANVAGIGGFSGRESDVSVAWLAQEVRSVRIRWVLAEASTGRAAVPGDTRVGAKPAMSAVASACRSVPLPVAGSRTRSGSASSTLYDCEGRAAALAVAGRAA